MNVKQEIDHRLENIKGDFENLSQDLRKGGRQVWLASLGAVSLVDEQGRALLGERFGELVEKGETRREQLRGSAREAFEKVSTKVKDLGREVETETTERVGRALERFGVPSSSQIQQLIAQVEQLNSKVEKLAHS